MPFVKGAHRHDHAYVTCTQRRPRDPQLGAGPRDHRTDADRAGRSRRAAYRRFGLWGACAV